MSQQIKVVYEDSVLKPLEPMELQEHQQVLITVPDETVPAAPQDQPSDCLIPFDGRRFPGLYSNE